MQAAHLREDFLLVGIGDEAFIPTLPLNCRTEWRIATERYTLGAASLTAVSLPLAHAVALEFAHCREQLKLQLTGASVADWFNTHIEQNTGDVAGNEILDLGQGVDQATEHPIEFRRDQDVAGTQRSDHLRAGFAFGEGYSSRYPGLDPQDDFTVGKVGSGNGAALAFLFAKGITFTALFGGAHSAVKVHLAGCGRRWIKVVDHDRDLFSACKTLTALPQTGQPYFRI